MHQFTRQQYILEKKYHKTAISIYTNNISHVRKKKKNSNIFGGEGGDGEGEGGDGEVVERIGFGGDGEVVQIIKKT